MVTEKKKNKIPELQKWSPPRTCSAACIAQWGPEPFLCRSTKYSHHQRSLLLYHFVHPYLYFYPFPPELFPPFLPCFSTKNTSQQISAYLLRLSHLINTINLIYLPLPRPRPLPFAFKGGITTSSPMWGSLSPAVLRVGLAMCDRVGLGLGLGLELGLGLWLGLGFGSVYC